MEKHIRPADIENTSMQIIENELQERQIFLPEEQKTIVKRVIHTTADFDYAKNLYFTENAVKKGVDVMRSGAHIVTDTNMAKAGISKLSLEKVKGSVQCFMADPQIAEMAKQLNSTRATASMLYAAQQCPGAVIACGNAPTALFELKKQIEQGYQPALVIGVPVGFVNVVEAKEEIFACCTEKKIPAIVAMGRKGGSNVAAAIVNALLYLASDMVKPENRGWN